jgi:lysine-N-methylase
MDKKKRLVLVPRYMKEFACTGSACEDTCCAGWQVYIDKNTYKKYNKVKDPVLKPLLEKHIKRIRPTQNDQAYAKILLDANHYCPMLTEEKLCNVQLNLGEKYLSNVCATYPRVTNIVNDLLEKSATLSCPEAARMALLNPDGIDFEEIEEDIDTQNLLFKQMNTVNLSANSYKTYFWEIRIFTIEVIQNREYSLADRLIILGLFYKKLQEYILDNNVTEIPKLISSYSNLISSGIIRESLKINSKHALIQLQLLRELAEERFSTGVVNQRYLDCFKAFLMGIKYDPEGKVEEMAEQYQQAYENYYQPLMDKHEYVLENYLVNYVFKNMFPSSENEKVFDEYAMLILHYGLIKMHLIGMAGHYKEDFNLDHVVMLIQSFARVVEHNSKYLRNIFELLKNNNYISMAYMAVFIKN